MQKKNYREVNLSEVDKLLCDLAWNLTLNPRKHTEEKEIIPLKTLGLSDRAILDATLVIGYFNFVNRIVTGLGVMIENNPGGFNYD